ncbi:MAG: prepilin-type N-terminal cleavage/methylation domain-containing protein [Candidatus Wildermuthbacteria bacterium]|nr:prepilin-type N-terminal cleavage/methylation domain-containing protein [Candidatus Wildermuthbacteria bacterium]
MKRGFTLIEVFIAIAVLAIGIGGVFLLVRQTVSFAPNTTQKLTATYLAQEGMEIARNIRDTNFLKIHKGQGGAWTDGLLGCVSGCQADYNDASLAVFSGSALKLNGGFYTYDSGSTTAFIRKIIVMQAGDVLDVTSEVSFEERGRTHTVRGSSKLYNWLTPTP